MKKTFTILAGALVAVLCCLQAVQAQTSDEKGKIKIKITRNIDGESQTLEKEYDSESEMRSDPEFKAFTEGEDHAFNFYFSDDDNTKFIEIGEFEDTKGNSFFFFSDDEDTDHNIRFFDGSDEDLEIEIEKIHEIIRDNIQGEEVEEQIKKIHEGLRILKDADSESFIYVTSDKNVKIVELEGEEFGKKGRVDDSRKLDLESLRFAPNPSDGKFRLQFNVPNEDEMNISIFNLEGKEVFNSYYDNFDGEYREEIDLTNRKPGIYLLEIAHGKKRLTRKIVVE